MRVRFPVRSAVGEFIDCSGRDLLLAYALGIEIATRLGLAANGTMHKTGFHTTGVVGHNACAVTAGKLLGLNADQLVNAQGLAGSTAAAIAEHRKDGAWNKRIHPGWAAVGGITAASLARAGFIGTKRVYEGGDGLFRTHAGSHFDDVDFDALTAGLGESMARRGSRDQAVSRLPHPACVHRFGDRAQEAARAQGRRYCESARAASSGHLPLRLRERRDAAPARDRLRREIQRALHDSGRAHTRQVRIRRARAGRDHRSRDSRACAESRARTRSEIGISPNIFRAVSRSRLRTAARLRITIA